MSFSFQENRAWLLEWEILRVQREACDDWLSEEEGRRMQSRKQNDPSEKGPSA